MQRRYPGAGAPAYSQAPIGTDAAGNPIYSNPDGNWGYPNGNGNGNGGACPPRGAFGFERALNYCAPRLPCCRIYYASAKSTVAILASASGSVTILPQLAFQANEVVISSTHTAPFFDINSITVGVIPQEVATGPASADVFSEVAVRSHLSMDPAWSGKSIIVSFTNIDADPHTFYVTMFGDSVVGVG